MTFNASIDALAAQFAGSPAAPASLADTRAAGNERFDRKLAAADCD